MNILVLGASGFIGNALFHALVSKHNVSIAGRTQIDGFKQWKHLDFALDNDWSSLLADVDLVINTIGIIEGDFDRVQTEGPIALFEACIAKNIKIINISAVGAEKDPPPTKFLQSKKATDDFLLTYENAKVIYPGIVIGRNGKSSQFFAAISQMGIIPLIKDDSPFVHISQLTELVAQVVDDFGAYDKQIFATAEDESLKDILNAMNRGKAIYIPVPQVAVKLFFGIFPKASIGIFSKNTLKMQAVISKSDYEPRFEKASSKIDPDNLIQSDAFVKAFALFAIMFIWVWSGVSSLVSWDTSNELMLEIGADESLAPVFIYLGSGVDIILGFAIYWTRHRKKIIITQILFIATYMLILTVLAPHYWMDPLGVLSKNIPLIALSYYLFQKETE